MHAQSGHRVLDKEMPKDQTPFTTSEDLGEKQRYWEQKQSTTVPAMGVGRPPKPPDPGPALPHPYKEPSSTPPSGENKNLLLFSLHPLYLPPLQQELQKSLS